SFTALLFIALCFSCIFAADTPTLACKSAILIDNDSGKLLYVINENEKVDARDYLLLKRAYFNTYVIPNPYVYIEIVEE
ncbi:MAG: hypothetical protein J6R35_05010, partial [Clostridia bacterium]|nr:hypothetical protein [Clostridia bacterium]